MDKNGSIADRVYDRLEEDILSGKYQRGEILSELKLSSMLNVSRTPIREALTRLLGEGLIKESGKGAVVLGVTEEDLADIFEIRLRLEGLAAAKCARNITPDQINNLQQVLELQEFYTYKNQPENIKKNDSEFHRLIFTYCNSKDLEKILCHLHKKIKQFRHASFGDKNRAEQAVAEHREIFSAIVNRDETLAEQLAVSHILNARNSIVKK